ncbi:hypothetical protein IWW36_000815 [Coemansia brasiliensis]|uniref:Ribosome recycling factor domain-containing protein n=1 Tax=Coemansia brasiliensis TaxID=2650707 RepID=A0A9W8M282_9FUNG|nr:hypothetical protein IWW36_000815 [Coemansia brasiliensis]
MLRLARISSTGSPARCLLKRTLQISYAATRPYTLSTIAVSPKSSAFQLQSIRSYGSKKKGGKKSKKEEEEDVEQFPPDRDPVDMDKMNQRMQAQVEWFTSELRSMRAGRANPGILSRVRVNFKGGSAMLSDLALVTVKDAHTLLVIPNNPDEQEAIEASIRNAGLGLNPRADKNAVLVPVPKTTKESREKLIKDLAGTAEKVRVHIRKHRQDAMKQLKAAVKAGLPKDESKTWEKSVQTETDKHIHQVDELLKAKSREIERG